MTSRDIFEMYMTRRDILEALRRDIFRGVQTSRDIFEAYMTSRDEYVSEIIKSINAIIYYSFIYQTNGLSNFTISVSNTRKIPFSNSRITVCVTVCKCSIKVAMNPYLEISPPSSKHC
ncbi:hypothetical protein CEXT_328101 [Caerostris extrusa]|uniref:Uncharacterized protein n=1 Tax=Caerostris extrusa TaxID=172846 RepID=A0AAV4QAH0_CAEEX|nr:hypothetical protein CEXT_328101 [Caerostris extrusa]